MKPAREFLQNYLRNQCSQVQSTDDDEDNGNGELSADFDQDVSLDYKMLHKIAWYMK